MNQSCQQKLTLKHILVRFLKTYIICDIEYWNYDIVVTNVQLKSQSYKDPKQSKYLRTP